MWEWYLINNHLYEYLIVNMRKLPDFEFECLIKILYVSHWYG